MPRYFTKSFYKFFFAFLFIIMMAFGVLTLAAALDQRPVDPATNVAGSN
jgi:lipopolysaccharide export LptBFGC system permease protein LptF